MSGDPDCIFCKIVAGEIPSFTVFEDDATLAFMDINPANEGHALVIPKEHASDLYAVSDETLARTAVTAKRVAGALARTLNPDGLNLVQCNGPAAAQSVMHFHVHVLPRVEDDRLAMNWGLKLGDIEAIGRLADRIRVWCEGSQISNGATTLTKFIGIKACVFDAYGTLFDVHSAVGKHRMRLGDKADAVSGMWRAKQLEYTWQRTILDRYVDFWRVTADSLDFALDAHAVGDAGLRDDLLNAYLSLDCYPEVPGVLGALQEAGLRTAILSNGSPMMLEAAVESAGIGDVLDAVVSVDELGKYKPSAEVYQLAMDVLEIGRAQVSFQSSNAWDAAAAATFGFRVAWCNRFGQARERLPDAPDVEIRTLDELPAIVLP